MERWISQADAAREMACEGYGDEKTIYVQLGQWKTGGKLKKDEKGNIEITEAHKLYDNIRGANKNHYTKNNKRKTTTKKAAEPPSPAELNYNKLLGQSRKSLADAEKAEHEAKVRRGELVEKKPLADSVFTYLEVLNNNIFSLSQSLADECISMVMAKKKRSKTEIQNAWKKQISKYIKDAKTSVEKELKKRATK